jgi:hypothetical protein
MDKTAAVGAGFPDRVVRAIMALVISKKKSDGLQPYVKED